MLEALPFLALGFWRGSLEPFDSATGAAHATARTSIASYGIAKCHNTGWGLAPTDGRIHQTMLMVLPLCAPCRRDQRIRKRDNR
jgi:hypothetical protein